MRSIATIVIDESHRQAWSTRPEVAASMNPVNPADASYAAAAAAATRAGFDVRVHTDGPISAEVLAGADALVLPHAADDAWERTTGTGSPVLSPAELDAIEDFVTGGGGLVILAETEQAKYGNNFAALASRFGIVIENTTVQDPSHAFKDVATWVMADLLRGEQHDLTANVAQACFYRAGTLAADSSSTTSVVARTSPAADPASAALVMTSAAGGGRCVVAADSDLFGDDSLSDLDHRALWLNVLTWAAGSRAAAGAATAMRPRAPWTATDPSWRALAGAVEAIRQMQSADGSIDATTHSLDDARAQVQAIVAAIDSLAPRFPHQSDHLTATVADLHTWADGGFDVPDFVGSLTAFRPDLMREDGVEHLAVFPMYTQNGNPNRNLEAVVTRTFWPDWLREQEATRYDNAAFVPIEFVGFTSGYDTHSAVFFPETVATSTTPTFHWGGIFCDREAARFRSVARAATQTLRLPLPPDIDLLLNDQRLAQETFVLWDLIHDRTHSHGDLPFDPFMIKQRLPYWMYALEELRCDLSTFRETLALDEAGVHLGRFVRYAIVFDRLFRFPISGTRVRNYDGLGGQILFAWLHRDGVVRWTDNMLMIDWSRLTDSVVALCEQVESLYHSGIDRSRVAQWLAAHEFVSGLVAAAPASTWARGVDALPVDGAPKELVDVVLPDEFPLNVFFESLSRKLAPTIASTSGITA